MTSKDLDLDAGNLVLQTWIAESSGLPAFRWLPRMCGVARDGRRFSVLQFVPGEDAVLAVDEFGNIKWFFLTDPDNYFVPDLHDGPTRGGLLELVREAYGDSKIAARWCGNSWCLIDEFAGPMFAGGRLLCSPTEGGLLAMALKAAPRSKEVFDMRIDVLEEAKAWSDVVAALEAEAGQCSKKESGTGHG